MLRLSGGNGPDNMSEIPIIRQIDLADRVLRLLRPPETAHLASVSLLGRPRPAQTPAYRP